MTAPIRTQPAPYRPRRGKPVILCVDDVKEILDTLEEQLSAHLGKEFAFELALSGEEGLEVIDDLLARGREIAVIISDVIMPGMKGDEFLIEAHRRSPQTLKIMLTGQESTLFQITNAINQAQLYRFLSKPWDILDMQRTIEEAARSYVQRTLIEEQNRILKLLHTAAQVIARQVSIDDVYGEILRLMLAYSGAEQAVLALYEGDSVVAKATAYAGQVPKLLPPEAHSAGTHMPVLWLGELRTTQRPVVSANAQADNLLRDDAYVRDSGVRSVVTLPLVNQGKLLGLVYLESRTEVGLFAADRLEVLDILAAQAAIAVENGLLYEDLEGQVAQRTKQLLAANIQKDEMVRFVSHEIRSPLAGIMSLVELLEEPDIARNASEVMRYGKMIRGSTSNVLKLANDILDLTKLQSGTITLSYSETDLPALINDVVQGLQPLATPKNLQLEVGPCAPLVSQLDASKVSSVLSNLLTNAIKFTPKGGAVRISLRTGTHASQPAAVLEVADTGIGIKDDQLPLLFEKFGAKQRLGTEGERGTGLGLSIVKELVALHGGTVAATSAVGVGSTFSVVLPLQPLS